MSCYFGPYHSRAIAVQWNAEDPTPTVTVQEPEVMVESALPQEGCHGQRHSLMNHVAARNQ